MNYTELDEYKHILDDFDDLTDNKNSVVFGKVGLYGSYKITLRTGKIIREEMVIGDLNPRIKKISIIGHQIKNTDDFQECFKIILDDIKSDKLKFANNKEKNLRKIIIMNFEENKLQGLEWTIDFFSHRNTVIKGEFEYRFVNYLKNN